MGKYHLFAARWNQCMHAWAAPRLDCVWNSSHNIFTQNFTLHELRAYYVRTVTQVDWQTPKNRGRKTKRGLLCCCLYTFVFKRMFGILKQSLKHNPKQQKNAIKIMLSVHTNFFLLIHTKGQIHIWGLSLKNSGNWQAKALPVQVPSALIKLPSA